MRDSRERAGTATAGRGGGYLFFSAGMPLRLTHGSIQEDGMDRLSQLFAHKERGW